jgi:hypothetical protein
VTPPAKYVLYHAVYNYTFTPLLTISWVDLLFIRTTRPRFTMPVAPAFGFLPRPPLSFRFFWRLIDCNNTSVYTVPPPNLRYPATCTIERHFQLFDIVQHIRFSWPTTNFLASVPKKSFRSSTRPHRLGFGEINNIDYSDFTVI